jgi:hypothetical protein
MAQILGFRHRAISVERYAATSRREGNAVPAMTETPGDAAPPTVNKFEPNIFPPTARIVEFDPLARRRLF